MMAIGIFLLTLCCLGFEYTAGQRIKTNHQYLTFKTKLNGIQNLSYAFSRKDGLTTDEKQAVLDMTNALRNFIAQGKEKRSRGGPMPVATNMLALEWEDYFADFAQAHAMKEKSEHSNLTKLRKGNYADASLKENLSGGLVAIDRDMYGEVVDWNYMTQQCVENKQCGHYFAVVSWAEMRMGCGQHAWKENGEDNLMLVCIFGPFATAGVYLLPGTPRRRFQYEYYSGKTPCSECPQGFDYCMGGGLCATKEQCDSDPDNNCVCTHNAAKCAANGGTFNAANCRCKCPKDRMGRNCASKCEDTPHATSCGEPCQGTTREIFLCPKTCGSCGRDVSRVYDEWMVKKRASNRNNLKVRARPPSPATRIPENVVTSSLPDRGNCKNLDYDYFCEHVRAAKYCDDTFDIARWRHYCAASCNSCDSKLWAIAVNATKKKGGSETAGWVAVDTKQNPSLKKYVGQSTSSSSATETSEWTSSPSTSSDHSSTSSASDWSSSEWKESSSTETSSSSPSSTSKNDGWSSTGWTET